VQKRKHTTRQNSTRTHLADVVAGLEDEAALAHEHLAGEGEVAVEHLGAEVARRAAVGLVARASALLLRRPFRCAARLGFWIGFVSAEVGWLMMCV
jgi:hypothetical protein